VNVIGAQAAGTALFDTTADAVVALSDDDRDTMLEQIQQVPYMGKLKIEWRPARKEFFIVLTSADRLPPSFMAEPVAQA
jgi:hypothetical protein